MYTKGLSFKQQLFELITFLGGESLVKATWGSALSVIKFLITKRATKAKIY